MSSVTSRKKRPGLLEVVNKLSDVISKKNLEKEDGDETPENIPVLEEHDRRSSTNRLIKSFPAPSSPPSSESSEDPLVTEKNGIEDVVKGPTQPMRCGVCGLRVYKSYRYISRSNAPTHLKNFFDPDTERFRVCKRCHSSKERCRQNLSLILLKSQTEQYTHLRSPLGTTHHRRSHSMKFLTRDIGRSLKRPYEDLICDETLDEDYLSDGDENLLVKATKKEPISANSPTCSNGAEKPTGTGVVTVVRPVRNTYEVYPNHFTTYGEITTKPNEEGKPNATNTELTTIKIFNKKPEEKSSDEDGETSSENASGELKSEIKTINYKLTLLDHAYALPAAKSVKLTNKLSKVPPASPTVKIPKTKIIKTDSLAKAAIKNMIKNNTQAKKKEAGTTTTENKDPASPRTCGIICTLCSNLVTKSYSCYRKENAPEKIRSLFTGDIKVMKVCRRCVPYKKPKSDDSSSKAKSKVKVSAMSKFLKQKVKHDKKPKMPLKLEAKQPSKPAEISSPKEKEKKEITVKTEHEIPVAPSLVHVSPKQDTKMVHVSIKNGKVENSSTSENPRDVFPPISTTRSVDEFKGQGTMFAYNSQGEKIVNTQRQTASVVLLKLKDLDAVTQDSVTSVDFGTQPMQCMIGVKKSKAKAARKENESGKGEEKEEGKSKTNNEQNIDQKEHECEGNINEKEPEQQDNTEENENDSIKETDRIEEKETKEKQDDEEKESIIHEESIEEETKEQDSNGKDNNDDKEEEITKVNEELSKVENQSRQTKENEIEVAMIEAATSKPTDTKPKSLKTPIMEPVRSSPRRDKTIIPPEKKKDISTDSKTTTVVTRKKRGISESESDDKNTKQNDNTTDSKETSDEKSSDKTAVPLKRSTRKGRGTKRKDSESSNASNVDVSKDNKKAKTDGEAKDGQPNHSYSTRYGQAPPKCSYCNEIFPKLFRVQNGRSPPHLKPLFEKEGTNTLKLCQKCRVAVFRKRKH